MKVLPSIFLLFLIISSCKNNVPAQPDFNYEVQVINELFPEITSEMRVWYGQPIPPPPPPPIRNETGKIIGYDSIIYKQQLLDYQLKVKNFHIEANSQLLAIADSMRSIKMDDLPKKQHVPSKEYLQPLQKAMKAPKSSQLVPLKSISNTGYFYLRYSSTFKGELGFWHQMYKEECRGFLYFSRIYFDETLTYGLFECSYLLAGENGHGGIIYIRKVNGKWNIEKYSNHWIS